MNTTESLPVTLYYDLLTDLNSVTYNVVYLITLLQKETALFLDALPDDAIRMATLEAKLKAIAQTYTHAAFAFHLDTDSNLKFIGEGFRKGEDFPEIQSVTEWLQQSNVATEKALSEYDYAMVKSAMKEEMVRFYYSDGATEYLQSEIWKIEGRIAMAAGYKADSGLRWNLTAKSPFTKTDFENLMSALWEKKFITHISGKKELAIKALYGVFDLPVPEKIGTNRHKAKASRTTSDNAYEIFDRLKAAHQQYLNTDPK